MSEKRKFAAFLILFLTLVLILPLSGQNVNTVVLDAGHGGHDTGALGKHSREKDIVLSIVLKLRKYIQEEMPDVKVILTRDSDQFVELHRRARIANESKADLFISVHCNANPSTSPYGSETYVMGLHKSSANLAVAKAENAAILLEDDYVEQYDGFDPNSPEGTIFFSMMQNAFLDRSLDFAGRVQKQFKGKLNLVDRGVKQAGFLVLYKTAMPGVLVETGFISNAREEMFLKSEKGQEQIAQAIFTALKEYKYAVEKKEMISVKEKDTIQSRPPEVITPKESIVLMETGASASENFVWYRVQFFSSPQEKEVDAAEFNRLNGVKRYVQNGLYKYTAGNFRTFREASDYRKEVLMLGYKDAFVVPFYNEARITMDEARKLEVK